MKSYHNYNEKILAQQCQIRFEICHFLHISLYVFLIYAIVNQTLLKGDLS